MPDVMKASVGLNDLTAQHVTLARGTSDKPIRQP